MNFRELEYFVAISTQKHFGKAARELNVSQPTLSMQFKKLEQRLGGKLIERSTRGTILTPLGTQVLPMARQILQLADSIENCNVATANHSKLSLGIIPTISPYLLPKINRSLSSNFKGRKIALTEAQTGDLVRLVKDGLLDAAILSLPISERGIEEINIFSEPFYLAVNSSHNLANRKKVSLKDIKNEKLLLLGEGHCLRNQALSICNLSQSDSDTDLTATSIETLRSMVALGAGVTLIPKLAIRKGDNVTYVPFSESTTSRIVGIIYRSSFYDLNFIDSLSQIVKDTARKINLPII